MTEEIYSPSIHLDVDFSLNSTRCVVADPLNACKPLRNNVTDLVVVIQSLSVGKVAVLRFC